MSAPLRAKAKQDAGNQSGAHRDKRYTIPVLSVDLFDKVHETQLWSLTHIILKDYEGPLETGAEFTGVFTFENRTAFGLFDGRIARYDPKRKMAGIEVTSLSKEGHSLLEFMASLRPADQPEKGAAMRMSLTHRTINWSLTGMLLDQYYGKLETNEVFKGIIRTDKAQESGIFMAKVVRANHERHTLALKFTSISPETFELLESAMKKNAAHQAAAAAAGH